MLAFLPQVSSSLTYIKGKRTSIFKTLPLCAHSLCVLRMTPRVLSPRATALESVSKGRAFHLCSDVYTCDLSSCAFVFEQSLPEVLVGQWPWWCFYFVPSTAGSRGGHGLSYASQGGYTSTLRSSERSRGGCT